jgi:sulfite reductase (ferredoxin)
MLLPKKIVDEIPRYKENLSKFLNGELKDAFFKGIRVPWGFYSQRGGEILMSRLRVPGGILTPSQLYHIGSAAKKYSDGKLHITTRQDIQIHNVPFENSIEIMEYLKDVNISPRGGGGNTIRNITGCYLSGICPQEHSDVYKIVWGLTEYLLSLDESYSLPRKIKMSFSGCEKDCACTGINDIGFIALKDGFKVLCGGGMGSKSAIGKVLHEKITHQEIGHCAKSIINLFNKHGNRKNRHHNRLRFLIEDLGWDKFLELYNRELNNTKDTEHIILKTKDDLPQLPSLGDSSLPQKNTQLGNKEYELFSRYCTGKQKQDGYCYVQIKIPLGEIEGDTLICLSELVDALPSLIFRTTQRQSLIISNIPAAKLSFVYEAIKDLLSESLAPEALLDTVCCKGALTCNLGICNSVGLASEISKELDTIPLDIDKLRGISININGCPNACGHHPIGMISFSGIARKVFNKTVPFYKIHLGGKVDAENTILAEPVGIVPARAIPGLLSEFICSLQEATDHSAYHYVTNQGKRFMEELIEKHSYVPPYQEDKSYYMDLGTTKDFSLEGLAKGECGSGAIDMIESDLASAKQSLVKARENDFDLNELKNALIYASRALLVIKGVDPKEESETIHSFIEHFIASGICAPEFANIHTVYENIMSNTIQKENAHEYATKLHEEVKEIYFLMDGAFNFPVRFKEESSLKDPASPAAETEVYDLRGTACPLNYVKAKLKLEGLKTGDVLELHLDEGEAMDNVPKSLKNDGQEILKAEVSDGFFKVIVKKNV